MTGWEKFKIMVMCVSLISALGCPTLAFILIRWASIKAIADSLTTCCKVSSSNLFDPETILLQIISSHKAVAMALCGFAALLVICATIICVH